MLTVALCLSVCVLLAGPIAGARLEHGSRASVAFRRVASVLAALVVLLWVLPHLVSEMGLLAPGLLVAGYAALSLLYWRSHQVAHTAMTALLPALVVHAFLDGASLGLLFGEVLPGAVRWPLASVLVAHRFPEGLLVRVMMAPRFGMPGVVAGVSALATATCLGAAFYGCALAHRDAQLLHGLVAFAMGGLLRTLHHRHT